MYKNSFIPLVVDDFNTLPQDIKKLDSDTSFKTYVDRDKAILNKLYI